MSNPAASLPDKTIVDRRKSVRNSDLRRALGVTRETLTTTSRIEPALNRQVFFQHVRAAESSLAALPVVITAAAAIGLLAGFGLEIVIWAIFANLLYLGLILLARRLSRTKVESTADLEKWAKRLLFAHILAGLGWAALPFLSCDTCASNDGVLFKAMVVLVGMAATATICFHLRGATLFAFALPVAAFLGKALISGYTQSHMIAIMLVLSLIFFSVLANRLARTSQATAEVQSRNDALIAELEMARSISEEARRRAEDANMAKSRFLASMSHELRTPLNAILGFSELMSNQVLGPIENPQYAAYVKDIHSSGEHLLNLINEILDLSRVEAGRYDMKNEAVRIDDIAHDCISLMRLRTESKSIKIIKDFEKDLPQMLGDERAIRQIALNLLSNAVKFTPENGTITVTVGWTASGGQYLSIKDTGPGIPEEEIPIVLSAFGQGSISIKNAEQGTGLGLPIVQALVALHDGKFKLESELRKGTRTTAFFPPKRTLEALPAKDDAAEKSLETVRQPA